MPLIHHCIKRPTMFALLLVLLVGYSTAMRQQSAGVTGRLFCGANPASNIRVKLFDKDTGPDPDDELDAGYTDANGRFELKGDTRELTNIDPQLKIYHACNKGINPCDIKWVLDIPDKYITNGPVPKKLFNLGDVNLEVELEGQGFDCIH